MYVNFAFTKLQFCTDLQRQNFKYFFSMASKDWVKSKHPSRRFRIKSQRRRIPVRRPNLIVSLGFKKVLIFFKNKFFPSLERLKMKKVRYRKVTSRNVSQSLTPHVTNCFYIQLHSNIVLNPFFRNKTFLFVKIESLYFQHLYDLGFRETSKNFSFLSRQTKRVCL